MGRFRALRGWSSAILITVLAVTGCVTAQMQSSGSATPSAASPPKADVIYIHGNVYTGVPATGEFSSMLRAEAIAVRGDRIQAVGKNVEIERLKGPQTQVVDLGGHFVMPGFTPTWACSHQTKRSAPMRRICSIT